MPLVLATAAPAPAAAVTTRAAADTPAASQQVQRGPVPGWAKPSEPMAVPADAGGAVFVRRQDVVVHLDPRGQSQYIGYRMRILQTAALELGNIALTWNPSSGTPTVHTIRVYRDGAMIDVLKSASFEILRREDQLEAARLTGMLTAVLRVPDLRVGDELEVEMTLPDSDPTMGGHNAGMLMLAPNPAMGRYRLAIDYGDRGPITTKLAKDIEAVATRTAHGIDLRFDNPATLTPPKDAPPRYGWQRIVQYSDFADWAAVSRHFAPLYQRAATLPAGSPIRQEAARIAAAHADPLARAAAALKLVQQNVRYIYVGLNGGNLVPASAEETWQRRYGDCKGKTALLLALLTELGIAAEPVLVNSAGADDGLDARLPLPQLFDHVLVRAQIGGKSYWLDGTLPPVAPPREQPVYAISWFLPLTAAGTPLQHRGWQPPRMPDELTLFELDARQGFDTPARITSTSIVRGIKGLQQQAQFSALSPAQLLSGFRQQAVGETWQAIDDVRWRYDEAAGASILTITGTGTMRWDDDSGGARSLALPGGGFSPPDRRVRASDQDQAIPFYSEPEYSCHVTTVRLPIATSAAQWTSKPAFDVKYFGRHYRRAFQLRDGSIRMIRASRVEEPEIDAMTAQRDNARIATFDNSMGWINFVPGEKNGRIGTGEQVPATFDFDWAGADVPCIEPLRRP